MISMPYRRREPVDVEDGVAYHASRRTLRTSRQARRASKRGSKLHRHRPPVSKNGDPDGIIEYRVVETTQFRRDVGSLKKRGMDLGPLEDVIAMLAKGEQLPPSYDDHPLDGNLEGYRECRNGPDWLLIYEIDGDILRAIGTGHRETLGWERAWYPCRSYRASGIAIKNP